MNDVAKLVDAICEGWTKCLPPPYGDGTFSSAQDGMTDCNRFTNLVCQRMGFTKFVSDGQHEPILANAMVDYMTAHPEEWKPVSGHNAQWYANLGVLVIAAWKNPTGGHGHVCVVRPGELTSSGHWNTSDVPKVANVSVPGLCRLDRGANYAFPDEPKYFALAAGAEGQ